MFKHFDQDQSGSIEGGELSQALQQFGYNLSPKLLSLVQRKYGKPAMFPRHRHSLSARPIGPDPSSATAAKSQYAAPPGITFDRFVRACVVIKQLSESFRKLDTDNDGWVQINYDQFMETVLQLP